MEKETISELYEREEDQDQPLKLHAARLSYKLGQRIPYLKGDSKVDLTASLSLLTQAMILAENEATEKDARKLIVIAKRLAR